MPSGRSSSTSTLPRTSPAPRPLAPASVASSQTTVSSAATTLSTRRRSSASSPADLSPRSRPTPPPSPPEPSRKPTLQTSRSPSSPFRTAGAAATAATAASSSPGSPRVRGYRRGDLLWITDLAVCDPVHRRYLLLPAIPADLTAAVHQPDIIDFETFLAPAAEDDKDTSFRVICLAQCAIKLVLFVFSSGEGRWHAVTFDDCSAMITGARNPASTGTGNPASGSELSQRYYAHRCLYWLMHRRNKLVLLNTSGMEFSTVVLPQDYTGEIAIVEAEKGKVGMLSLCSLIPHGTIHLSYAILQNDGETANQWQPEEVLPLPKNHRYDIVGVVGGYLLLQGIPDGVSLLHPPKNPNLTCFSLEVKTLNLELFCQTNYSILHAELYAGHPPSLSPPSV